MKNVANKSVADM